MARFLNLNRMLDVNRGEAEQMGQQAVNAMQPQLTDAGNAINHVAADDGLGGNAASAVGAAEAKLAMAGTQGGRAAMIGPGANSLDAFLAGNSGALADTRKRYSDLMGRLQSAQGQGQHIHQQKAEQNALNAANQPQGETAADRLAREEEERRKKGAAYSTYANNVARSSGPGDVHNTYF